MDKQPKFELFYHPKFGKIFTTVSESGDILFKAKDVAVALGYTNPAKAVRDHCEGVNELFTPTENQYGTVVMQPTKFIPEYDVYALIFGSKLPAAKEFRRWVYREVLPTIRQHGAYMTPSVLDRFVKNPQGVIELIKDLWEQLDIFKKKDAKYVEQENVVEEQKKKIRIQGNLIESQNQAILERDKEIYSQRLRADFTEEFKATDRVMDVTEIAHPYGMTAQQLNKILCNLKVQRFVNGRWMPNKEYAHMAKTTLYRHGDVIQPWTQWYPEGVMMIYELLRRVGYKTLQEKSREQNLFSGTLYA